MRSQDLRCYLILERIRTLLLSKSFRMKNFPSILPWIKPNNEAISLDIQDAYLQVPILSSSWGGGHLPEGPRAPFGHYLDNWLLRTDSKQIQVLIRSSKALGFLIN